MANPGTSPAYKDLGFNAGEGMDGKPTKPDWDATGRGAAADGEVAVPRVASEYTDQANPTDQRKGGKPGSDAGIIADTAVAYDGEGRGTGKKYTNGSWDPNR